jgi:drug/metabolite transporter (DMT)-like permease
MLKLFTQFHVLISLIGIAAGFVVIFGMISGTPADIWTVIFLITTVATSATGFLFPFQKLLPSHIVGIISLVVLALAIYARYAAHLAGSFAWIFVVCAVFAQYLNFFVLIVQSFQKIPPLKALAPTQTETPFKIAQGLALLAFVGLGIEAVTGFHG